MRRAGFAMLVAMAVGGAWAQPVSEPTGSKVTQVANDAVKTSVSEVGKDMNREVRALQDDVQSEAQRDARVDRGTADKAKVPDVKPCKDCIKPAKPH